MRRAARAPGAPGDAPRLLLLRPDHLGDLLLTAPAIAELRAARPDAWLVYLVGPWGVEAARLSAPADEVRALPFPGFTRQAARNPLAPYLLLLRAAGRLRRERFDAAVVLRPDHWWGALLVALADIPIRIGYDLPECRPFLTDALPLPPRTHSSERARALVRRAADLAPRAGAPQRDRSRVGDLAGGPRRSVAWPAVGWSGARCSAPARPGGGGTADGREGHPVPGGQAPQPPSAEGGADPAPAFRADEERLIVIHPGSGAAVKNWPAERWAAVAGELSRRCRARVVVTAGPEEGALARAVAAGVPGGAPALIGPPLAELAALYRRADLVLGGDSGPLHLAEAAGARTLRLYGPSDERIYGPRGPAERHAVLRVELPCAPCGNLVAPPCGARSTPPCLAAIAVGDVVARAEALLVGQREGPATGRPAPSPEGGRNDTPAAPLRGEEWRRSREQG